MTKVNHVERCPANPLDSASFDFESLHLYTLLDYTNINTTIVFPYARIIEFLAIRTHEIARVVSVFRTVN